MNRQEHLLVILMEECAEVQHAAAKTLRFGKDDTYADRASNVEQLRLEVTDLMAVVEMLSAEGINMSTPYLEKQCKQTKVNHYLEYSKQQGTLD